MNARVRLALIVIASMVIVAATAVVVFAGSSDDDSGAGFAGAVAPPGVKPVDFALRDQGSRPASLAEYRGRVVVLTFLYTTCEDTCPVTATTIRGALDDLGHDVPTLAVSVDPAHDTPDTAQRFLLARGLSGGRMRFLLGDRAQLAPVWDAYGIQPQGKGFEHTARVLVLDRTGRQRVAFPVDQLTSEGLAHDVRLLEAER